MNADPGGCLFIDTNILVYAYDRTAGEKRRVAAQLLERCWESEKGCLSVQVLQEFYVAVTQKIARPLDRQAARQLVEDLSFWRVHAPQAEDILQAIDLQQSHPLSFWDAMVINSAARLGCQYLYSEDLAHGQVYGGVKVVNPFVQDQA